jgi:hypothetical protein
MAKRAGLGALLILGLICSPIFGADAVKVRDGVGREVFAPFDPKRIVCLGPGCLYCRPPALVQDPELDHGRIDQSSHLPTQGIHFTDQIPFRQSANCRVTRHLPYAV